MHFTARRVISGIAVVTALAALTLAPRNVSACDEVVSWYANLTGDVQTPAVQTTATGKATYAFDFEHPDATITVNTKDVQDVKKIEFLVSTEYGKLDGAPVIVLYTPKDGKYTGELTKKITDADIAKQTNPKITNVQDLAQQVIANRAFVRVYTKAHPQGEISGMIGMHKSIVYSANSASGIHDPALHHAAEARQTPSATVSPATKPSTQ